MERATLSATRAPAPVPEVVSPTGSERVRVILVLGPFIALGPLTIDMYLPALPAIADELGTSSAAVQLTLTGTLPAWGSGSSPIGPFPTPSAGGCP